MTQSAPRKFVLPFHSQTPLVSELAHQFPVDTPELQGCLSLSYSGNPGVNGVSDRGANWKRLGQGNRTWRVLSAKNARLDYGVVQLVTF